MLNVSLSVSTELCNNRISTTNGVHAGATHGVGGVLHRTMHELHSMKLDGVIFKIDFDKVYNNVAFSLL